MNSLSRNSPMMLRIFLLLLILPFHAYAGNEPVSITVLASSSLTNVMTDLIRVYSVKENITVSAIYESSDELASSIEAGEEADVYISEHPAMITNLKRQGLFDVSSLTPLVSNEIVLVASSKSYLVTSANAINKNLSMSEIMKDINERTLIVMGNPDLIWVGYLARRAIERMGHWDKIEPFIIRAGNVRDALYLIAKGRSAGIVYASDAFNNPEVEVISEFPPDSHDKIIYQAAVVAGEHMSHARKFMEFLKSDEAKEIFEKHGFRSI